MKRGGDGEAKDVIEEERTENEKEKEEMDRRRT